MTIRGKLKIIIGVLLLMGVAFWLTVKVNLKKYEAAFAKVKTSELIAQKVFQRRLIAGEYLANPSERAKQQWYIAHQDLQKITAASKNDFNKTAEKPLVENLENDSQASLRIFDQMVQGGTAEKMQQLRGELNVKAQEAILSATKLTDINIRDSSTIFSSIILLFFFASLLFFLVLLICLRVIWKSAGQLEREKAQASAILGGIGDAVFAIDRLSKIILFNPVAEQISGFSAHEAIGKPYQEILKFSNEDTGEVKDDFIKSALAGKKSNMANHTVVINRAGQKIPVGDSAAPIFDESNKVAGVVVVFRDATQERAIDKTKTEFVSLASHQLRTPLTAIAWYTEMLMEGDAGKLKPKQLDFAKNIHEGNSRMIALVNSLLNVSRVDLGTFEVAPVPMDVTLVLESLLGEMKQQIQAKKLVTRKNYEAGLGSLNLDPQLIRMVLQNLLSNAVKYTPEKATIALGIGKQAENLLITISDTGYGIPEKQQSKIFTKLFRADNAVQKEAEGNGLGLYIVKAIVEQSQGKIWFESQENKGTTFYIQLPLSGMKPKSGAKALS